MLGLYLPGLKEQDAKGLALELPGFLLPGKEEAGVQVFGIH